MRNSNYIIFGLVCFLALCAVLAVPATASSNTVKSPEFQLQSTPTPPPEARWRIVDSDTATDWLVYPSIGYISAIAPDTNVIWAVSNAGLLRLDRDSGDLDQYLAPYFPLPSNDLSDVLLHGEELYISGELGLTIFDQQETWTYYSSEDIGLEMGWSTPLAMIDGVLWICKNITSRIGQLNFGFERGRIV